MIYKEEEEEYDMKDEKTITVTDYGGYEHKQSIKSFIMDLLPMIIILGLIILGFILALKYRKNKPEYISAVIVGEPSVVVHIDHYESDNGRYILYDKDGSVYSADESNVVFYNYDKEN